MLLGVLMLQIIIVLFRGETYFATGVGLLGIPHGESCFAALGKNSILMGNCAIWGNSIAAVQLAISLDRVSRRVSIYISCIHIHDQCMIVFYTHI